MNCKNQLLTTTMNDDNNPNIALSIWSRGVRAGSLQTKIGLRCSVTDNGCNCVKYDSCAVTLTHNVILLLYYVAGQMSHYLLSTLQLTTHRPCGPGPCCPWSWCHTSGTHHSCPLPRTWKPDIANVDEDKYRYLLYATFDWKWIRYVDLCSTSSSPAAVQSPSALPPRASNPQPSPSATSGNAEFVAKNVCNYSQDALPINCMPTTTLLISATTDTWRLLEGIHNHQSKQNLIFHRQ